MTMSYVLLQNLRRNRLRTALTAVAFALPMGIFVAAISFGVALAEIGRINEQELRLGVHHKVSLTIGLPERQRREIEAMDPQRRRLRAVCGMRWFGGRVPDTQNTLTSLAADADTFPVVYSDVEMNAGEEADWSRERRACVVGAAIAETYGWKRGDRVTLNSTVPPYLSLEFLIVKIVTTPGRTNFFYFRRDYLEESLKEKGIDNPRCNIFWVKCNSIDGLQSLQREIDASFANSPEETKTEDENTFGASFAQAAGNLPGLMQVMAILVLIITALVAGNTMMMSFRERTRELAVFKAIGFPSGHVFRIVLGESILLAMLGAAAGVLPTAAALTAFPLRRLNFGPISSLEISPVAIAGSLGIALVVGLVAGIWPAYQALRLQTVNALRRVA